MEKGGTDVFNLLTVISYRSTGNTREARKFMVGLNTRGVSFGSLRFFPRGISGPTPIFVLFSHSQLG